MSIYPVRLEKWFPPKDDHRQGALLTVKDNSCKVCGKKDINPKWAYIYHSAPWGYYTEDVWCSRKCFLNKEDK